MLEHGRLREISDLMLKNGGNGPFRVFLHLSSKLQPEDWAQVLDFHMKRLREHTFAVSSEHALGQVSEERLVHSHFFISPALFAGLNRVTIFTDPEEVRHGFAAEIAHLLLWQLMLVLERTRYDILVQDEGESEAQKWLENFRHGLCEPQVAAGLARYYRTLLDNYGLHPDGELHAMAEGFGYESEALRALDAVSASMP